MCTGFAAYYDEPFYGMNFDFINVDLNFRIHEYSDRKVFMFYYKQKRIDIAVAGMNSFGLFANYQVLIPNNEDAYHKFYEPTNVLRNLLNPKAKVFQSIMPKLLNKASSAQQVKSYLERNKFYFLPFKKMYKHHSLYADQKEAFIFETNDCNSDIIPMKNQYSVISNFPHVPFQEVDYSETYGFNCEAYKKANDYIIEQSKCFTLDKALKTLELSTRMSGEFRTRTSIVFLPLRQEVIISFDGDFEHIWKVNITKNTLDYRDAQNKTKSITITKEGIPKSELLNYDRIHNKHRNYFQ
jgi:hypothetical protein